MTGILNLKDYQELVSELSEMSRPYEIYEKVSTLAEYHCINNPIFFIELEKAIKRVYPKGVFPPHVTEESIFYKETFDKYKPCANPALQVAAFAISYLIELPERKEALRLLNGDLNEADITKIVSRFEMFSEYFNSKDGKDEYEQLQERLFDLAIQPKFDKYKYNVIIDSETALLLSEYYFSKLIEEEDLLPTDRALHYKDTYENARFVFRTLNQFDDLGDELQVIFNENGERFLNSIPGLSLRDFVTFESEKWTSCIQFLSSAEFVKKIVRKYLDMLTRKGDEIDGKMIPAKINPDASFYTDLNISQLEGLNEFLNKKKIISTWNFTQFEKAFNNLKTLDDIKPIKWLLKKSNGTDIKTIFILLYHICNHEFIATKSKKSFCEKIRRHFVNSDNELLKLSSMQSLYSEMDFDSEIKSILHSTNFDQQRTLTGYLHDHFPQVDFKPI